MFKFKTENDIKDRAKIVELEDAVADLKDLIKKERK